jgi:Polysaccharide lyase
MAYAVNLLSADGPGATYELVEQSYNAEVPDCGHMVPHITEEFDGELGKNVFIFHAHVLLDDDRCGATDRQRTEIRARVADISAQNGDTVFYRWKFKLPAGFQASESFTHIFQIKSNQADPVMTLSPYTSTFGIRGRIGTHATTALSKFVGVWVVVELTAVFRNAGNVAMTIRRISDGETLLSYSGNADMWDDGSGGHDPKFGIYRSLDHRNVLRDEQVRFADFCVSKVSASECPDDVAPPTDAGVVRDAGGALDATGQMDARQYDVGGGGTGGTVGAGGAAMPPAGGSGGSMPMDAGHAVRPTPGDLQGGCSCKLGSSGGTPGTAVAFVGMAAGAWALTRRRRPTSGHDSISTG